MLRSGQGWWPPPLTVSLTVKYPFFFLMTSLRWDSVERVIDGKALRMFQPIWTPPPSAKMRLSWAWRWQGSEDVPTVSCLRSNLPPPALPAAPPWHAPHTTSHALYTLQPRALPYTIPTAPPALHSSPEGNPLQYKLEYPLHYTLQPKAPLTLPLCAALTYVVVSDTVARHLPDQRSASRIPQHPPP